MDDRAEHIEELVARCLLRLEEDGGALDDAVAAECNPDDAPAVTRRIEALAGLGFCGDPDSRDTTGGDRVAAEPAGTRLGPYVLLDELGRGGQGTVFRARDERVDRDVAVKLLPESAGLLLDLTRFRREARALARISHPGLCALLEVGDDGGRPYLVMPLVRGETLAARLAAGRPPRGDVDASLALVEKLARALHAAHGEGLVHRDVKPGNVMVGDDGEPVLLDFGLVQMEDAATITATGTPLGTPVYMAPEQVRGEAVDARTDVYALGLLLHECLTGEAAQAAPTREAVYRRILEDGATPLTTGVRGRRRDLDIVLATACAREPSRRYLTAGALADDLARVRERRPVLARPAGPLERLAGWCRRRPALALALAGLFLSLAAGLAVSLSLLDRAGRNLRAEREAHRRADGLRLAAQARHHVERDPARALLLAIAASERHRSPEADDVLLAALGALHEERTHTADANVRSLCLVAGDAPRIVSADDRGVVRVDGRGETRREIARLDATATLVRARPGRDEVAVVTADGVVRVLDVAGREVLSVWEHPAPVVAAAWSGGDRLASLDAEGTLRVWRADTGKAARSAFDSPARCLAALDDRSLSVGCEDGDVLLAAPGRAFAEVARLDTPVVALAAAGHHLVAVAASGRALAVNVDLAARGEAVVLPAPAGAGSAVAVSPDGALAVTLPSTPADSAPRTLLVADTAGGDVVARLAAGVSPYLACFSDDGGHVAVAASGGIRVFETRTGEPTCRLRGHAGAVNAMVFTGGGRRLVTAGTDGTVRVWAVRRDGALPVLRGHRPGAGVAPIAYSPDGASIASASDDGTARVFDTATGAERLVLRHDDVVYPVTFSPDGMRVLTASYDHTARVWDAASGRELVRLEHPGRLFSAAWHPRGALVMTTAWDGVARLWDARSGELLREYTGEEGVPLHVGRFDASGARFAAGSESGRVFVWDVSDGSVVADLTGHRGGVIHLRFGPRGERLVTASLDHRAVIWDVRSARPLHEVVHGNAVWGVELSPDGTRVATASADHAARVFRLEDGGVEHVLTGHTDTVYACAFSPDGTRLVTGSADGTARVWDLATGATRLVCTGHEAAVYPVAFSPDGATIAAGGFDGTVRLWPLDPLPMARRLAPRTPSPRDLESLP